MHAILCDNFETELARDDTKVNGHCCITTLGRYVKRNRSTLYYTRMIVWKNQRNLVRSISFPEFSNTERAIVGNLIFNTRRPFPAYILFNLFQ